jgi:hypothetical protein
VGAVNELIASRRCRPGGGNSRLQISCEKIIPDGLPQETGRGIIGLMPCIGGWRDHSSR